MSYDPIPDDELAEMERTAIDLARLAGAEIQNSLGRTLSVRYKSGDDDRAVYRDPVSEVDQRCEALIRDRLADLFPSHGILGEEMDPKGAESDEFVWAVDPIDGTANFVNGFPLFAACVGVLHRRRPIVGAIWCAASHALRPGIYHAAHGGPLCFEGEIIDPRGNPAVRRRLAGEPSWADDVHGPWDVRKTGSAAIECSFVAAGLLSVARFERPNVWDVAGGIVLVEAAGLEVHTRGPDGWTEFSTFEPTETSPDFRHWRQALVIGEPEAASQMMARLG
ncbi:inositol monophosphatase family protein [Enterovirga rhinocerotis]|uniref:Myo-inositol-1(Or 4)-monophosphatase n=1 Tax=Enterovirga rhinocerotis TaxID=1339210 RepID=A0A4R7BQR1_9HYPH|nr:inositol monophosphatase [Enterovirga rhinocerotis]TDR87968.1 myo-inositol-1(or 4)-monophosphatase [Enterovirga rhinocerotis]